MCHSNQSELLECHIERSVDVCSLSKPLTVSSQFEVGAERWSKWSIIKQIYRWSYYCQQQRKEWSWNSFSTTKWLGRFQNQNIKWYWFGNQFEQQSCDWAQTRKPRFIKGVCYEVCRDHGASGFWNDQFWACESLKSIALANVRDSVDLSKYFAGPSDWLFQSRHEPGQWAPKPQHISIGHAALLPISTRRYIQPSLYEIP